MLRYITSTPYRQEAILRTSSLREMNMASFGIILISELIIMMLYEGLC